MKQLILKKKRDRAVRLRHPWVFSGAIQRKDTLEEGEIVQIVSHEGEILAYGHYSERSQISARIFEFTTEEQSFEAEYWLQKFRAAWQFRQRWIDTSQTTGFRWIHAEGDHLPGIIADVYQDVVSFQLRTKGAESLRELMLQFLQEECGIQHVFDKSKTKQGKGGKWLVGGIEEQVFLENGLKLYVNVKEGQKTGFFLDQRDNRAHLGQFAKGRNVLNMFSYTGGFSVYALAGGANAVTSVDISKKAVEMCERQVKLNDLDVTKHKGLVADCFEYLREMPDNEYDMIVLDPPAFSKSIATVKNASRGYKDINLKAFNKIQAGGLLHTYSCSQHISRDLFRKIVFGAAADAGRKVRIVAQLSQSLDHPINIYHPEGEYLKGLVLAVD